MTSNEKSTEVMEDVDVEALVDRCLTLLEESNKDNHKASSCWSGFNCYRQVFIGVGGTPGSGKSFIAEQVRDAINKRNPSGDPSKDECVVIGMDGYHLSRAQLKQKAENGDTFKSEQFSDGQTEKQLSFDELMARRGAGFTYCPKSFIRDLKKLKEAGEGSFPVYSREEHDPIPNGVSVGKSNKVILVEGLYLLCLDDPDWKPLGDLWDSKWFIEVSREVTQERLIQRHLENWNDEKTKRWGGNGREAAARKAEDNDLKNARCILKNSKGNATLIIKNESIAEVDTNNADVTAN